MNIDETLIKYFPDKDIILAVEDDALKQAIKEIVTDVIQLCADNARLEAKDMILQVDKQSILDTIDEIKF